MTILVWVLLGFALWTIAVLMAGIGIRRWALILTGRAQLVDFPADQAHGSMAYRRAVRAHANCVENLPVYGAIVFALSASQTASATIDTLAVVFLIARVCQSMVHMSFTETNATVLIRFSFFAVQLAVMLTLIVMVMGHVR